MQNNICQVFILGTPSTAYFLDAHRNTIYTESHLAHNFVWRLPADGNKKIRLISLSLLSSLLREFNGAV